MLAFFQFTEPHFGLYVRGVEKRTSCKLDFLRQDAVLVSPKINEIV